MPPRAASSARSRPRPAGRIIDPDFRQLDSWIVIRQDNTATFYVGKTDLGQGTGTAFRQIMSDELDINFDATSVVMGTTDLTVDQGGSGGSDALQTDGWPMRRVAAEARRVLLDMGAASLGVPVSQLAVSDGVITVKGDATKRVTYGQLVGGKRFNVTLTGNTTEATTGRAPLKTVQEMKMTGRSPRRYDIPPKVDGSLKWAVDAKVPGMLHARNVKPPTAGAQLVSVDEASVRSVPGLVKVVRKGNYLAVVCEREEQAIQAARQLKAEWRSRPRRRSRPRTISSPTCAAPRRLSARRRRWPAIPMRRSPAAARVLEADYDVPFQGHTAIGPAHALADPSNGQLTIYSNDMKSYGLRNGVARFLNLPREQVRVVWMEGPQAYGRTAADDAGFEAAFLAKELGRPVRVQWMRNEETAWDTKGPAYAVKMRGALDAQGNLTALEWDGRAADHNHVGYNEPDTVLIAQLANMRKATPSRGVLVHAVEHVRHPQPAHAHARGEPAARVGDAAAHRQPARPRRPAGHVRVRVVHRRAGGRGQGGPARVPDEAADRQPRRRHGLQAGAVDRVPEGGGREVRLGAAAVAEAGRQRRDPDAAAAWPTRSAARRWWRRSWTSR